MYKILMLIGFVALIGTPAEAQQTCSKLAAECVSYNKARGHDTARCGGYKSDCMKSGSWRDRNRSFDNVTKR